MHTARKFQPRDSYFTLIIRLSVSGIRKNFEESISPLHPTHPSFRDTVISGASFCAISARTMRYVQERTASSLEKITGKTTSFIGQISRPPEGSSFYPYARLPSEDAARHDKDESNLVFTKAVRKILVDEIRAGFG